MRTSGRTTCITNSGNCQTTWYGMKLDVELEGSNKEMKVKDKKEKKSKKEKTKDKKVKKVKVKSQDDTEDQVEITKNNENPEESEEDVENGKENGHALSEEEKKGAFENFNISSSTIEKLKEKRVTYLFPIQAKTYDIVYGGTNLIAQARTGTGKTLSFALPLVELLQKSEKVQKKGRAPMVLVMAPTRELAKQVCEDFTAISTNLSAFCIYGGTPYAPQEQALRAGLDVLVGTPGRIYDHIEKGNLDLSKVKHVVLDEVDQMLDMGFADIVDNILQHAYLEDRKKKPQTLLFSATLPPWVQQTGKKYFGDDVEKVSLVGTMENRTSKTVQHLAIKCSYFDRAATIGDVVKVYSGNYGRAMIFCETKRDADELAVSPAIKQDSQVLHGDIPQAKRERVLQSFRDGRCKVLISTDVAARGLDIPEIDLVIQCNPPKDVDSYIHRSGRTGRAGRSGTCICFYKPQEEYDLQLVERRANLKFKKIGGPTTDDIIKASVTDAARSIEAVDTRTLEHFRDSAEALVNERGAVDAVAAALAVISGSTKIVSRSLLSSKEGFTTYLFTTNIEMRSVSYVWRSIEKQIPEDIKEKIMRMRLCKDKMSSVFDLPSEHDDDVTDKWIDTRFDTLIKATALPELLESESSSNGGGGYRGGGFSGRGRGGFSSRGRGDNSFRGRQNGSSGRGRGGFRGQNGFSRGGGFAGQKRKFDGFGGESSNKKIKFD